MPGYSSTSRGGPREARAQPSIELYHLEESLPGLRLRKSVTSRLREMIFPKKSKGQGHVNCAAPKILSCEPPSGFIMEEDSAPARIVTVPANPGTHCAKPFWSTVMPGFMFPKAHAAARSRAPRHIFTSKFLRRWFLAESAGSGERDLAAGEVLWSADAGLSVTDCNWRLLPQGGAGKILSGSWQPSHSRSRILDDGAVKRVASPRLSLLIPLAYFLVDDKPAKTGFARAITSDSRRKPVSR